MINNFSLLYHRIYGSTNSVSDMPPSSSSLLCLSLALLTLTSSSLGEIHVSTVNVSKYAKVASCLNSAVYRVELPPGSGYESPPLLVHLTGSRHDMGYAYGNMLTSQIKMAYQDMISWLLKSFSFLQPLLEDVLDFEWKHHLSKQLPHTYVTELQGLADGAAKNGCKQCGAYTTRAYVLANLPSDGKDILKLLLGEYNQSLGLSVLADRLKGFMCSMVAVWGSRTLDHKLFSARNLDWNKDTGINKHKTVMVTVPNDGGIPSVSVGFVGLYGPLAGMSAGGLTVHEANLEENWESLDGFPWVLRLRYIMENATDIESAKSLWWTTHNTVGFNHMVASGKDATDYVKNGGHSIVALAMETMYGYTAYFHDNDPREADALYSSKADTPPVHIGFPLHEALWRTNHGYDPVIRKHFQWSQDPSSWSMQRYMFIHNAIVDYEAAKVPIGALQAMNITAIAGNKGTHAYTCANNTDGTNILSTVFQPQDKVMYVAWERSSGQDWRPAVCSKYVVFDLKSWFSPTPPVN